MVPRARCRYDHRQLGFLEKVKVWACTIVHGQSAPALRYACVHIYFKYAYDRETCVAWLLFIAAIMRTSFAVRSNLMGAPFVFCPCLGLLFSSDKRWVRFDMVKNVLVLFFLNK